MRVTGGPADGIGGREAGEVHPPDLVRGVDTSSPLDLVVLAMRDRNARCRVLASRKKLAFRFRGTLDAVPGEIVTVRPVRQWRFEEHLHLTGRVEGIRLDDEAFRFHRLAVARVGKWNPAAAGGGAVAGWAGGNRAVVSRRWPRAYEMQLVAPAPDPADPYADPFLKATAFHAEGDVAAARKVLMWILGGDLRCLDAHVLLGDLARGDSPALAGRHYEVAVRLGERALRGLPDGVLLPDRPGNRSFLRCLHRYGTCLRLLDRTAEAAAVFERMLRLDPTDHRHARLLLARPGVGSSTDEVLHSTDSERSGAGGAARAAGRSMGIGGGEETEEPARGPGESPAGGDDGEE